MKENKRKVRAIGLFSGGLDSILACRTIAAQGIEVKALKFVTPFFDHDLLAREEQYQAEVLAKYGIDVQLVDLSQGYIELLRNPAHGFGKNFNPCIDCKILMVKRARELMSEYGASFIITGEVLGQRPMSQRRDTLRVVERDSGGEDILLRPLCAKLLNETRAEREGLVDRSRLHDFSGRGRKRQMELAAQFGIKDYPNAAGGCLLTDPNLAKRIARFYAGEFLLSQEDFEVDDIRFLLLGRQFRLPGAGWLILGRTKAENDAARKLRGADDWLLKMVERPGPTGILRRAGQTLAGSPMLEQTLRQAAGLVVRYGRKQGGEPTPADVKIDMGRESRIIHAEPVTVEDAQNWLV